MRILLFLLVLSLNTVVLRSQGVQQDLIWNTYKTGPFKVGFISKVLQDPSRTVRGESRPVQLNLWYPSGQKDFSKKIIFRDYFQLSLREGGDNKEEDIRESELKYKNLAIQSGIKSIALDSLFNMEMIATSNASKLDNAFPIILVGQGNGHAVFNQVILCEFLASNGYMVISTPSPTRMGGGFQNYNEMVNTARDQALDLQLSFIYVANNILNQPEVKKGFLGYSFGGRAGLLLAVEDRDLLDAFVSWDSGIGNEYNKEWVDYINDFNPEEIIFPLLHIYQPGDRSVSPGFDLINSFNSEYQELIRINGVNHGFFMIRGAADGALNQFQNEPYDKAEEKYSLLLSKTLEFFNRFLNN